MSGLYFEVEVFGGTDIHMAASQARAVAMKLGIPVRFTFNGVDCMVHANDTPSEVSASQQVAQRLNLRHLSQARAITAERRAEVLAVQGHSWKHENATDALKSPPTQESK